MSSDPFFILPKMLTFYQQLLQQYLPKGLTLDKQPGSGVMYREHYTSGCLPKKNGLISGGAVAKLYPEESYSVWANSQ